LESRGIRIIAPVFAQSMLDTPSLPGSMQVAIEHASDTRPLIIDMGGDDEGAKAMGRFSDAVKSSAAPYAMLYVINERREIESPEETAQMLKKIERRCKLEATGVVNNTHLSEETTLSVVEASAPFAEKTASLLGLPIVCTAVPARDVQHARVVRPFPVERHVRMPWE
uniref:ParA family protein n=1 Tax=Slackia piriformis TaxID=626934 RepID=UPI0023EF7FC4